MNIYNDSSLDEKTVSVKIEPKPRPESNPDIYLYVLPTPTTSRQQCCKGTIKPVQYSTYC